MPNRCQRPQATCHPDRPHYAHGLCAACDLRRRYHEKYKHTDRAEKTKQWAKNNPEKRKEIERRYRLSEKGIRSSRARGKRYWARHIEMVRERLRLRRAANPEKQRSYAKLYAGLHPEKRRANEAKRRALKLGNGDASTVAQRESRAVLFGWQCAYCGGPYEHMDHVVALTKGGTDRPENLVPACAGCNQRKRTREWKVWYRQQAFYSPEREAFIERSCA